MKTICIIKRWGPVCNECMQNNRASIFLIIQLNIQLIIALLFREIVWGILYHSPHSNSVIELTEEFGRWVVSEGFCSHHIYISLIFMYRRHWKATNGYSSLFVFQNIFSWETCLEAKDWHFETPLSFTFTWKYNVWLVLYDLCSWDVSLNAPRKIWIVCDVLRVL